MITVCIPIHNYYVVPLVESIAKQAEGRGVEVEIVCIDDGSESDYVERNRAVERYGRYVVLGENVGRAAVRNLFLRHGKGEYMLFLDDDGVVPEGFIARYEAAMRDNPDVIVGGRVYDPRFDDREHRLRYTYGLHAECRSAEKRRQEPHRCFMTNNFIIRRSLMETIRFDERLRGYGHEDTLFGYRLRQKGIEIMHIENPVINGDVEPNALFLEKSEEAVRSLAQIYNMMREDRDFCESVRLLRTYRKTRAFHWLLRLAFRCLRGPMKRGFETGRCASMALFNFYKLGIMMGNEGENMGVKES